MGKRIEKLKKERIEPLEEKVEELEERLDALEEWKTELWDTDHPMTPEETVKAADSISRIPAVMRGAELMATAHKTKQKDEVKDACKEHGKAGVPDMSPEPLTEKKDEKRNPDKIPTPIEIVTLTAKVPESKPKEEKDADEIKSPASVPAHKQAEGGKRVRKQNPEGEKATKKGEKEEQVEEKK